MRIDSRFHYDESRSFHIASSTRAFSPGLYPFKHEPVESGFVYRPSDHPFCRIRAQGLWLEGLLCQTLFASFSADSLATAGEASSGIPKASNKQMTAPPAGTKPANEEPLISLTFRTHHPKNAFFSRPSTKPRLKSFKLSFDNSTFPGFAYFLT